MHLQTPRIPPLARNRVFSGLSERAPRQHASHRLLADGGVSISLPSSGVISDAEARRLAWSLLSDLAPEQVMPVPTAVTYKESHRLGVLSAVLAGAETIPAIAAALGWSRRTAERRIHELVADGRLSINRPSRNSFARIRLTDEGRADA